MKWISLLFLINIASTFGQEMRYFSTKDSIYIGVKKGDKIIVPLGKHRMTYYVDFNEPINAPVFELPGNLNNKPFQKSQVAIPANTVYNSKGKPSYYTLLFDNGSDYFQEDVQRIVSIRTGKVGFADNKGTVVVKPKWDFATSFNYGYAIVMNDVKRDNKDDEHWTIVPNAENSFQGYVNKKGKLIKPYANKQHSKDYKINENEFLPNPFKYSKKEKEILNEFQKYYEVINNISLNNLYTNNTREEASLQFEIVRKPSKSFPYYKIQAYRFQQNDDSFTFLYHQKTEKFYFIDYPFKISEDNLVPIKTFIISKLKDICEEQQTREYQGEFVFDACKSLKDWESK